MQSTGHGSMHSSQPVQWSAITVCMSLAAPTMASTGQALMHKVQPMHSCSRITAITVGASTPNSGFSGITSRFSSVANASTVASPPGGH